MSIIYYLCLTTDSNMERHIDINSFDYPLPEERIAKFPLENRTDSKLMVYRNGDVSESRFRNLADHLPAGSMLVFNNTRVNPQGQESRYSVLNRTTRPTMSVRLLHARSASGVVL